MDERIAAIARGLEHGRLSLNPLADGSGVVIDTGPENLWTMNASAMAIVQAIAEGAGSVEDISERLQARFQVEPARARADIGDCLDRLHQALASA